MRQKNGRDRYAARPISFAVSYRGRRAAVAPVSFYHIPAVCELWFLPSAVCC
jgi:hypothetical protein